MKNKHTLGPWMYEATHGNLWIWGNEKQKIVMHVSHEAELKDEIRAENEANAKLIAAAPDLLAALEDLIFTATKLWDEVKPIKDGPAITVTHPIIEQAKETIKRATI